MPITKDRMHQLLVAATEIEQHFTSTTGTILHICSQVVIDEQSSTEALAQIAHLCSTADKRITTQHHLLQLEAMHYRLTHKKTEYDRLRRERARHPQLADLIEPTLRERRTAHTPHAPQPQVVTYDEDTLREMSGGDDSQYIPLSNAQLREDYTPDFIGGRSFEDMQAEQIASTHDTPHVATLHADNTISCSCGQVARKSHTIWLEHYLMTHPAPITR